MRISALLVSNRLWCPEEHVSWRNIPITPARADRSEGVLGNFLIFTKTLEFFEYLTN